MDRNSPAYRNYVEILRRELVCAMGCTEPIAIAYCAAVARAALGALPEWVRIESSGNIIKNVKSVVVPNTDGRRGIAAAAAIGILGGDETAGLQVISAVSEAAKARLGEYLEKTPIETLPAETDYLLDITVSVGAGGHTARVRAVQEHTNLVLVERDGAVLESRPLPEIDHAADSAGADPSAMTVEGICEFAATCELDDVREVLERQIACNSAIADEGLRGDWGANIGKVLLTQGDDVRTRAKARAAAGSDARMNGCELPVVINSGSGNQGMTASLPVIEYARALGASEDELLRALLVSNLVTLHEKTGIGRLSAYCGAVSAGAGAGAGIAWLHGGGYNEVAHTIVNALAITSGIVCDGAKSSCAGKIAMAVDAGILGYEMYRAGQQFYGGDGLVRKGVEKSIESFGRLGRVGMRETDKEIIRMMTDC